MNRDQALDSVRASVQNENLIKHMLATEAVMRELAKRFGEDEEEWALAGLLHDIDVELTGGDMGRHGKQGAEMARELGAGEPVAHAILCHNERHGVPCETTMDRALLCADPLTGLITAAVLVRPDKQIANLEVRSVKKRFKEKGFAAGVDREQLARCSELGLELDDFIGTGIEAMQKVAGPLGL